MKKIGYIIKNNFKLIWRNKALIIIIMVGVLLVILALSNAFHDLLGQAERAANFTVGYQMSSDSIYKAYEDTFVSSLDDEGVSCRKYADEQPEKVIENGDVEVFVDFSGDGYHIYGGSDSELQTRTIQYVLFAADETILAAMSGQPKAVFEPTALPHTETADAQNYYSIVELAYFISLSALFLSMVVSEERKNRISLRYRIGNVGRAGLYFGKLIPCALTAIATLVVIDGTLATLLFDVEWGSIPTAFGLLCLASFAFTAFGMIFILLFDNMAASIGALFAVIWFAGFAGGTFESYMYSAFPESVKRLSPIYYVNRTLCEYSVSGHSDYLAPCILYLAVITVVSVALGILLTGRKER